MAKPSFPGPPSGKDPSGQQTSSTAQPEPGSRNTPTSSDSEAEGWVPTQTTWVTLIGGAIVTVILGALDLYHVRIDETLAAAITTIVATIATYVFGHGRK
jgi:hypothetical protein